MIDQIKLALKKNKWLYDRVKIMTDIRCNVGNKYFIKKLILYCVMPQIRKISGRKDTKDILKFYNIHKGKRIFIIATGPSVRETDILKLKDEITIAVNGAVALTKKVGWKPTYYCFSDKEVYTKYKKEIIEAEYENILLGVNLKKYGYESELAYKPYYYEQYMKLQDLLRSAHNRKMSFSDDIIDGGVYTGGRSITTNAVQIAAYMGAETIYLYGQDCDYSSAQHFDDRDELPSKQLIESGYFLSKAIFSFYEYADRHCRQRNIRIYNATRGGKLEVLERVDFDEIFED